MQSHTLSTDTKAKRRIAHQPRRLEMQETNDKLEMRFRTNWQLHQDGSFILTLMALVMVTAIFITTFTMIVVYAEAAFNFRLSLAFVIGLLAYRIGLRIFNKTHILLTDETLQVVRKPLPMFGNQLAHIDLTDVVAITVENIQTHARPEHHVPRGNVWVRYADNTHQVIAANISLEYAHFIAQRIEDHLYTDYLDTSRLVDAQCDDDKTSDEVIQRDQKQEAHYS